ncbi:MAG: hypothetical protein RLZ12_708, partial [Bacillota bacterium]
MKLLQIFKSLGAMLLPFHFTAAEDPQKTAAKQDAPLTQDPQLPTCKYAENNLLFDEIREAIDTPGVVNYHHREATANLFFVKKGGRTAYLVNPAGDAGEPTPQEYVNFINRIDAKAKAMGLHTEHENFPNGGRDLWVSAKPLKKGAKDFKRLGYPCDLPDGHAQYKITVDFDIQHDGESYPLTSFVTTAKAHKKHKP